MKKIPASELIKQVGAALKSAWEKINAEEETRVIPPRREITDKQRSIHVRDTLRAEWDKLHDERNGFGVHSDAGLYRYRALERVKEVSVALANAEANVRAYEPAEPS